jgi:cysteinyl-tRNA synthetase
MYHYAAGMVRTEINSQLQKPSSVKEYEEAWIHDKQLQAEVLRVNTQLKDAIAERDAVPPMAPERVPLEAKVEQYREAMTTAQSNLNQFRWDQGPEICAALEAGPPVTKEQAALDVRHEAEKEKLEKALEKSKDALEAKIERGEIKNPEAAREHHENVAKESRDKMEAQQKAEREEMQRRAAERDAAVQQRLDEDRSRN